MLEESSHAAGVAAALDTVGLLSGQLNFGTPQSANSSGAGMHIGEDDTVRVLSDDGRVLGTAVVSRVGGSFHFQRITAETAVVHGLIITDARAAGEQSAWYGDNDVVEASVTRLAEVPSGQMLAVPIRCLRFLSRPSPGIDSRA